MNLTPHERAIWEQGYMEGQRKGYADGLREGQADAAAGACLTAPQAAPVRPREGARAQARAFLLEVLADGPQPVTEVRRLAEHWRYAWRTVQNAKKDLGVESRRRERRWWWESPAKAAS